MACRKTLPIVPRSRRAVSLRPLVSMYCKSWRISADVISLMGRSASGFPRTSKSYRVFAIVASAASFAFQSRDVLFSQDAERGAGIGQRGQFLGLALARRINAVKKLLLEYFALVGGLDNRHQRVRIECQNLLLLGKPVLELPKLRSVRFDDEWRPPASASLHAFSRGLARRTARSVRLMRVSPFCLGVSFWKNTPKHERFAMCKRERSGDAGCRLHIAAISARLFVGLTKLAKVFAHLAAGLRCQRQPCHVRAGRWAGQHASIPTEPSHRFRPPQSAHVPCGCQNSSCHRGSA